MSIQGISGNAGCQHTAWTGNCNGRSGAEKTTAGDRQTSTEAAVVTRSGEDDRQAEGAAYMDRPGRHRGHGKGVGLSQDRLNRRLEHMEKMGFDTADLKKVIDNFEDIDENGDGRVSRRELREAAEDYEFDVRALRHGRRPQAGEAASGETPPAEGGPEVPAGDTQPAEGSTEPPANSAVPLEGDAPVPAAAAAAKKVVPAAVKAPETPVNTEDASPAVEPPAEEPPKPELSVALEPGKDGGPLRLSVSFNPKTFQAFQVSLYIQQNSVGENIYNTSVDAVA
ncbi:MAG: hypothetical protein AB7P76_06205 [Candidatus Melainabacteria bacterium]